MEDVMYYARENTENSLSGDSFYVTKIEKRFSQKKNFRGRIL